jgi:flagellar protein FlaG
MNIVQNVKELGVTGLASEYKRTNETIKENTALQKNTDEENADKKQIIATQKLTAEDATDKPLTAEQLDKVAQQLQDFVGDLNRNIEFSVDKDSGRDVIKVIDKDSGDLLKQYPSEEVLTLVSKLSDMVGGFVDAKV